MAAGRPLRPSSRRGDRGLRKEIVYVSTVGIFGNTRGEVVNEGFTPAEDEFLSYYEDTKHLAHQVALERVERGAPIVVVQPGGVYGPGDTSGLANLIKQVRAGRMKSLMFPNTGFNFWCRLAASSTGSSARRSISRRRSARRTT